MTKEEIIENEDDSFDKAKSQKKIKRWKITIIITSILVFAIVFSYVVAAANLSYSTDAIHKDIKFRYTVYNNTVTIKITPYVDIRDLEIALIFESGKWITNNEYKINKKIQDAPKGITIKYTYNLSAIKEKLKGDDLARADLQLIAGKIRNNEASRTYEIKYDNECSFKFEMKAIPSMFFNKYETVIHCTVKNKTNKPILSIQHLDVQVLFGNKSGNIYISNITFESPLKPNESCTVMIDSFNGTPLPATAEDIINKYNNSLKSTSYKNQEYAVVYGE